MGVRRFVNLLVWNHRTAMYSLRRFDLSRNQFFYPTPEEAATHGQVLPVHRDAPRSSSPKKAYGKKKKQLAASEIKPIRLPVASHLNMQPASCPKLDAFPLSERKILFADGHGRVFTFDADARCLVTMPGLHAPKASPLAFSIPGGEEDGEGSFYIMESSFYAERSSQFEALLSDKSSNDPWRSWECRTLPPPPLDELHVSICSSAVVGDVICVSACGFGTYCFDTASHSWSRAGDWILPFFGSAEYAPELGLWFGVSPTGGPHDLPCAADLSPVLRGRPPEPAVVWGDYVPEEWHHSGHSPSRLLSLGAGRLCMIRLLETTTPCDSEIYHFRFVDAAYVVFTGLEVLPANGKRRLRMIRHKTRRYSNLDNNFIKFVL